MIPLILVIALIFIARDYGSLKEGFWSWEFYFVVLNIFIPWAFYDHVTWISDRYVMSILGYNMEGFLG